MLPPMCGCCWALWLTPPGPPPGGWLLGCFWMVSSWPSNWFKYWICCGDGTGIKLGSLLLLLLMLLALLLLMLWLTPPPIDVGGMFELGMLKCMPGLMLGQGTEHTRTHGRGRGERTDRHTWGGDNKQKKSNSELEPGQGTEREVVLAHWVHSPVLLLLLLTSIGPLLPGQSFGKGMPPGPPPPPMPPRGIMPDPPGCKGDVAGCCCCCCCCMGTDAERCVWW